MMNILDYETYPYGDKALRDEYFKENGVLRLNDSYALTFQGKDFIIKGMAIIVSLDSLDNNKLALHVSASYKYRLPSYDELIAVKDCFIGDNLETVHVLPKKNEQILHLWAKLEDGYCNDVIHRYFM